MMKIKNLNLTFLEKVPLQNFRISLIVDILLSIHFSCNDENRITEQIKQLSGQCSNFFLRQVSSSLGNIYSPVLMCVMHRNNENKTAKNLCYKKRVI
jgi:hypothetical protein